MRQGMRMKLGVWLMLSVFSGAACAKTESAVQSGGPVATDLAPATADSSSSVSTYSDGYGFGQRNGSIMVERLRHRTVDLQGCRAVGQLEQALVRVVRTVRPPAEGQAYTRGYFRGYLDALRQGIRETREDCHVRHYDKGIFAGSLYGALLCQIHEVSAEAAASLEVEPLYAGWSGDSDTVLQQCRVAASAAVQECGGEGLARIFQTALDRSCSDPQREE